MPMNGTLLGKEILDAIGGEATDERKAAFEKLGKAIVAHIQANATLLSDAPIGVGLTTAPGGGPVTGVLLVTVPVIK